MKKEGGRLDSVNVSTPDHMHALMATEAMRQGKHVYVQKPLANTLRETRTLTEYARKARVDLADGHPGLVRGAAALR